MSTYCTIPSHKAGRHGIACLPLADPRDPGLRLIRATFGLCPDCDSMDPHEHTEDSVREQDKSTSYAEVLERREEAMARFSLAHQRLISAQVELEDAEGELAAADRQLALALGLPGTRGANLGDIT